MKTPRIGRIFTSHLPHRPALAHVSNAGKPGILISGLRTANALRCQRERIEISGKKYLKGTTAPPSHPFAQELIGASATARGY